jgi:hypothetical protein
MLNIKDVLVGAGATGGLVGSRVVTRGAIYGGVGYLTTGGVGYLTKDDSYLLSVGGGVLIGCYYCAWNKNDEGFFNSNGTTFFSLAYIFYFEGTYLLLYSISDSSL